MSAANSTENGSFRQWVVGQTEPSGQFTVQVVGIPEMHATAASRAEAIACVQAMFTEWVAAGRLSAIEVPGPNSLLYFPDHLDPNDPLEQEFLAELAQRRQKDREQAIREDDPKCLNSSSTPTT